MRRFYLEPSKCFKISTNYYPIIIIIPIIIQLFNQLLFHYIFIISTTHEMSTLHKWSPWTWLSRLFHKLVYISHLFSCTLQFSEWPRPSRSKRLTPIFPLAMWSLNNDPIRIARYTKRTTTHKTLHLLYVTRQTHPSRPPKRSPACSHATMSPYNARPHKQTYTYVHTAHLGHPTKDLPLLVPLQQCCFVHLRNDGDAAHNGGCLRLCPTHTTQTWTDKHLQQGKWVLHVLHIQGTY